jgi:hypothetical protein
MHRMYWTQIVLLHLQEPETDVFVIPHLMRDPDLLVDPRVKPEDDREDKIQQSVARVGMQGVGIGLRPEGDP